MALRNLAVVCALIAVLALLCGCASLISLGKPIPGPFRHMSINQNDEMIALDEDDRLVLDLPYRADYQWVVTRKPDRKVMTPFTHKPEYETIAHERMQLLYFYAVDPGITVIEVQQVPLKGKGPAVGRFEITVDVSSG